jgi:hypothetical protein
MSGLSRACVLYDLLLCQRKVHILCGNAITEETCIVCRLRRSDFFASWTMTCQQQHNRFPHGCDIFEDRPSVAYMFILQCYGFREVLSESLGAADLGACICFRGQAAWLQDNDSQAAAPAGVARFDRMHSMHLWSATPVQRVSATSCWLFSFTQAFVRKKRCFV